MNYFLRHGEKVDNSPNSPLTEQGKIDSQELGKQFKLENIQINHIISSPISRCVQTAQYFLKGYNKNIHIEKSTLWGNPGVFVIKDTDIFKTHTVLEVINMQLSKNAPKEFRDIEKGVELLDDNIKNNQNTLFISHDVIITPFIAFKRNKFHIEKNKILKYLEYVEL
jgi:hypothetical protein